MAPKRLAIKQLTLAEQSKIDDVLRKEKGTATDALSRVNAGRLRKGIRTLEKSAVHRYAKARTHKRSSPETRGCKKLLTKRDVRTLDQARRRLIIKADNEVRITHAAVIKEAGLKGVACQRVCEDALRAEGVSFKAPRRKIQISEDDAKIRLTVSKKWLKRPSKYWSNMHAYVDNKAFPTPRTPKQRKKFRQTMITGHLRKASEGVDKGFTKPREKHSFIGVPAVTISAAVAKDKIIMWHVVPGAWNGAAAATMYEEHLKPVLERT